METNSRKPIARYQELGTFGRSRLKVARRRYGKFVWNSLARAKNDGERNRILELAGRRAIERGLYVPSVGWRVCIGACVRWAFFSYAGFPWGSCKEARTLFYSWANKVGFCYYEGRFTGIKISQAEDAA